MTDSDMRVYIILDTIISGPAKISLRNSFPHLMTCLTIYLDLEDAEGEENKGQEGVLI